MKFTSSARWNSRSLGRQWDARVDLAGLAADILGFKEDQAS